MPKARRPKKQTKTPAAKPKALHYKVIELSAVDETSLERTVNEWVGLGWTFDGVQFATRESSKRPAMAFIFFTREGAAADVQPSRGVGEAQEKLRRLAATQDPPMRVVSAYERLVQLAEDGDDE
jgi:hypothetical protein